MKRKPDPLLRTQPWKILAVFSPIEQILNRLESEGTVDVAGRQVVFKEDMRGGWYDAVAALRGVIEFHQLAESRHGHHANVDALIKFANKLEADSPIFEADLGQVRDCIASCKRQAMQLRVSQATDIVQTIQISMRLEKLKEAA